ncbi:hypothetical protein [Arthrobacter sp. CAN_A1]|uniref:hypothetical protein n=1 Tax=Arthrobacter sp. CAN_A1 TaxID=2787717 RepID=UPI0018CA2EFC
MGQREAVTRAMATRYGRSGRAGKKNNLAPLCWAVQGTTCGRLLPDLLPDLVPQL